MGCVLYDDIMAWRKGRVYRGTAGLVILPRQHSSGKEDNPSTPPLTPHDQDKQDVLTICDLPLQEDNVLGAGWETLRKVAVA